MTPFHRLIDTIQLTNKRYRLFKKGDSLLLGLSGGPDSTGLLLLLCALRRKYSISIATAHLDHGLNKKKGLEYSRFSKNIAEKHRIPFFLKKVPVRKIARLKGLSIEEAGRNERYTFFCEVAKKIGANKIVTAHTMDDQAETMLMRIIRGTGLRGLTGIPFKRNHGPLEVIRPLLLCQKKDIILFLKKSGTGFVTDVTNFKFDFFRNRIRYELLPLLRRHYNVNIERSLAGLQTISYEASGHLKESAGRAFQKCLLSSSRQTRLDIKKLKNLNGAILSEVIFIALARHASHLKRYTQTHIASIISIVVSDEADLELSLPDGVCVKKTKDSLQFKNHPGRSH